MLCAVGKPGWAPCPQQGLSGPSSSPRCGRPHALCGSCVVIRAGTLPQAGGARVGLGSTSLAAFSLFRLPFCSWDLTRPPGGLQPCGPRGVTARRPGVTQTRVVPGRLHGSGGSRQMGSAGQGASPTPAGGPASPGILLQGPSSSSPPVADRGSGLGLGVLPAHNEERPGWLRLGP